MRGGQLSGQALSWEKVDLFENGGVSVCPKESQRTQGPSDGSVGAPRVVCVEVPGFRGHCPRSCKDCFFFQNPLEGK